MQTAKINIKDKTFSAVVVDTEESRQIGLSNTDHLPSGKGMLFVFDGPQDVTMNMVSMAFPLDMIFIDADDTVIAVRQLSPGRYDTSVDNVAYVHDIGIKVAEEKYGSSNGRLQEQEGPAVAEEMLGRLHFDEKIIRRVSYLVGHHHTYDQIDGLDYQILVEADFLVNLYEDGVTKEAVMHAYNKIFRTEHGKRICAEMFGIEE
jgi:uncharacterized membrane protein (UPF0127 family)